ncbi:MAG: hypothetical protein AAFO69_15980, partial [Bacteroidota bacterium]
TLPLPGIQPIIVDNDGKELTGNGGVAKAGLLGVTPAMGEMRMPPPTNRLLLPYHSPEFNLLLSIMMVKNLQGMVSKVTYA